MSWPLSNYSFFKKNRIESRDFIRLPLHKTIVKSIISWFDVVIWFDGFMMQAFM